LVTRRPKNPLSRFWQKIGRAQYLTLGHVARLSASLKRKSVTINGLHAPYLVGGTGPNLLLVHGFNSDKEVWLLSARALRKKFRVYALDLPGFGAATDIDPSDCTATFFSEFLCAFIAELGIGPVHAVGHSMGGGVCIRLAHDHPELLRNLVLLCSTGPIVTPSPVFRSLATGKNLLAPSSQGEYRALLKLAFKKKPFFPPPVWSYLGAQSIAKHDTLAKKFLSWTAATAEAGIPTDLEAVSVPTLVLHGSHDQIVDPSTGAELAARIPDARHQTLAGLGHMPQLEAPTLTARALSSGLNPR